MMRKPTSTMTLSMSSINYVNKVAKRHGFSKSKAADALFFANECEIDTDTLDYIITNLYKPRDGRKGRKIK